ncbi:response regulator transcription factor [Azoarcus sp. KH32C]|uniref:response regulator transcription factor n=1 Tax=Azoarcus sp. KH32C TaxID=748247 RepID=UPI0002386BC0|nr:response regulator [Azoarcus sp. KH32C]BAL25988.1 two-component transcriptional regulator, LuxR family [Azoarcus sp. KH32C]
MPTCQIATGSVCVVDDDEQVRRFLVEVFTSVGLQVQAIASGEEFIRTWHPDGPSCVLLDLRMPRMTGPEIHEWLRAHHPEVPVIFLTGYADVPTAVAAMRLGAFDFLEKPFNIQHLIERTQDALRKAGQSRADRSAGIAWLATLTPREREVLDGIVAGQRNKTIAAALGISERTVETHRANIMHKSRTHSVAELVALVLANSGGR